MQKLLWLAGTLTTVFLVSTARAESIDHAREYESCMALVERAPKEAFDAALAWRDVGGGDGAEHCLAKALLWMKQYREAAGRLENLAQTVRAEAPFRAALLGQAAQAWLLEGDAPRAEAVLTAALELAPEDTDLLIDRARARAEIGAYEDAVADLDAALARAPERADALLYRASAWRYLDRLDEARTDVERALTLAPGDSRALLERGNIRRLQGDNEGARQDWLQVVKQAPGTTAAKHAQANLAKMDVKPGND